MGTATLVLNVPHTTVPPQLGELYQRHADVVYRAALRVTGSPADAEDVLHTVFRRLLNREDLVETARAPEAYFRRAATNAAIDILRRRTSRAEKPADDQMSAPASSPILKERLRRAIAQLPPRDAELFSLRYVEGISNSELADMLGMERVTVGTRLHRIRSGTVPWLCDPQNVKALTRGAEKAKAKRTRLERVAYENVDRDCSLAGSRR